MPMMAGSSRSFLVSVTLKWKGDDVWITASKGGSDLMASSNASGVAIVFDDDEVELGFRDVGVVFENVFAFLLGAH